MKGKILLNGTANVIFTAPVLGNKLKFYTSALSYEIYFWVGRELRAVLIFPKTLSVKTPGL